MTVVPEQNEKKNLTSLFTHTVHILFTYMIEYDGEVQRSLNAPLVPRVGRGKYQDEKIIYQTNSSIENPDPSLG